MSVDQFKEKSEELTALLTRVSSKVAGTSNAVEYNRFLTKTLEKAQTFDAKNKTAYKDYGLEAIEKQNKTQKKSGESEEKAKKRKTDAGSDEEKNKKAKKPDAGEKAKKKKPVSADEF